MTDDASLESAVAETVKVWGCLDGWVNNAGAIRMDPALDVRDADWDLQMRVNVAGLFAGAGPPPGR